jgi:hypothetical protein
MCPFCDEVPLREVNVRVMCLFPVAVKFPKREAAAEEFNPCSAW